MRIIRRIVVFFAVALVVAGVSVTGYHWYRGASAGDALRMTADDARVAVQCPTEPHNVWQFVQRSQFENMGVRAADKLGADWVDLVCKGATV